MEIPGAKAMSDAAMMPVLGTSEEKKSLTPQAGGLQPRTRGEKMSSAEDAELGRMCSTPKRCRKTFSVRIYQRVGSLQYHSKQRLISGE
jgi:hypothetical protein